MENKVGEVAPPEEIDIAEVEEDESNHPPPALDEGDLLNLDVEDVADLPHVKVRSLLHHYIKQKKVVFLSLDLETGGEDCGIIQISGEIIRPELAREGGKVPKDTLANVTREGTLYNPETNPGGGLFNAYVHPGEDAEWSPAAIEVTGLSRTDQRITSAKNIDEVWSSFSQWVESNIAEDEVGVIVAYHGAGSDMKWIWRLCMAPNATQTLPRSLLFFMDPLKMIKKWKSMNIHPKKSKLESLSLSFVYQYIHNGQVLEGAHDSLVDARARSDLLLHSFFVPYLDRTNSFCSVDDIFGKNQLSEMKRQLEPIRPVHAPWIEQTAEDNIEWEATR